MRVRLAAVVDIPAIIEVELSASALFMNTHMDWAVGEVSTPEELAAPIEQGHVWVAEHDHEIAGYLCGEPLGDHFYIEEVSVAAGYQRRGIGRLLIVTVADEARRQGFSALSLTTDRTLPWNAPYYERLGFRTLTSEQTPSPLAAELAAKPNAHLRCAMLRDL